MLHPGAKLVADNNWKQMLFQHPTVIWMQVGQEGAFSTKPPSAESQHPSRGPAGVPTLSPAVLHTPACPPPTSGSPVKLFMKQYSGPAPRGKLGIMNGSANRRPRRLNGPGAVLLGRGLAPWRLLPTATVVGTLLGHVGGC